MQYINIYFHVQLLNGIISYCNIVLKTSLDYHVHCIRKKPDVAIFYCIPLFILVHENSRKYSTTSSYNKNIISSVQPVVFSELVFKDQYVIAH